VLYPIKKVEQNIFHSTFFITKQLSK